MKKEFTMTLNETVALDATTSLTFASMSVEEIAELPDDPKNYPSGSGLTVDLVVKKGQTSSQNLRLSQLSEGYTSTPSVLWDDKKITLVKTEDEMRQPHIVISVETWAQGEGDTLGKKLNH